MESYKKYNVLQQIRKQINLNEVNIKQKGGNLKILQNKLPSVKNVFDNFQNYQNNIINEKMIQEKHILTLLNYLDKSSLNYKLTDNTINQINHERKILTKELEKIRSKLKQLI